MSEQPQAICGEVSDSDDVICPRCGYRIRGYECETLHREESEYRECDECGAKFYARVSVSYTYATSEVIGVMPCPLRLGEPHHNCSLCGGTGVVPKTAADQWLEDYRKGAPK